LPRISGTACINKIEYLSLVPIFKQTFQPSYAVQKIL
jgi:hypothetical protein